MFTIVFPGFIVGLLNAQAVTDSLVAFILVAYSASKCLTAPQISPTNANIVFTSLSVGSILLILILYKYVKSRRLVAGYSRRGHWWASGESSGQRDFSQQGTMDSGVVSNTRRSIYDRALLIRFSIGFVILA